MQDMNQSIVFLLGGFLLKELFDWFKEKTNKDDDKRDQAIEENTKAMHKLEGAIIELKVELKFALDRLLLIPKIEKDVNEAHTKIRSLEQGNGK